MWIRNSLALVLLASACGLASAEKQRIEYRVTRVAPLISTGFAINNAGATVGDFQFTGAGAHGFLNRDNRTIEIGGLQDFRNFSIALDINDRFQVVGTSFVGEGTRGFIWERGVLRDVNVFLPATTTATGINKAGFITGAYQFNFGPQRGYVRARAGSFRDIGTLPFANPFTLPEAINKRGQIVGNSDHLGPFVYRGKHMERLNSLIDPAGGYTITSVQGINDKGQIAGSADQAGVAFGFAVRLDPIRPKLSAAPALEEDED